MVCLMARHGRRSGFRCLRLEKAGRKIRVYVNDTLRLPYAEPARVRRLTRRTQRGKIQVCYRSR